MPSSDASSTGVTWKELAARTRTFRLEIAYFFETTDPRAIAEELDDLAAKPEPGQAAQVAAHYAELARQGQRFVGTAVLTGGPRDRHAREDYHHAFRVLIHQAIRLAGFFLAEEDAFQMWSECLRRRKYKLKSGTVEDAGEATALLCEHLSAIDDAAVRREFAFAQLDVFEAPELGDELVSPTVNSSSLNTASEQTVNVEAAPVDVRPDIVADVTMELQPAAVVGSTVVEELTPAPSVPAPPTPLPSPNNPLPDTRPPRSVQQAAEPLNVTRVFDERPPLKLKEAATRLRMSVATLKRKGARGEITILKLGPKTLRVSVAEVERALRSPEFQKYQFPDRDR